MTSEKKPSLFDRMYNASKDALAIARKPLVKRKTKRKYQTAVDSAIDQKQTAEEALAQQYENVENLDLNRILNLENTIKSATLTIEVLQKSYSDLFDETLDLPSEAE